VGIGSRYGAYLQRLSKRHSRKGLYEFLRSEFSTIPAGAQVLSVGSGGKVNELLHQYADSRSFQVVEFDIDEKRGPDVVGDICTYDFGDRRFDVVIISEVLEHVHTPQDAVRNIHDILVPGGRLVLTTPFMLPIHERPVDFYRYTRYGLEFLLREFRDVEVRERNSYFEAIDVLWLRLFEADGRIPRAALAIIMPMVAVGKRPVTRMLEGMIKTDAMTTGYVVRAVK
jgi:SAM-dependent methyltransferase